MSKKLKYIEGLLPKKAIVKGENWGADGFNQAIDKLAEKEIEIDVEQAKVIAICEGQRAWEDKLTRGATYKQIAEAIAKEFPVRVKK